MTSPHPDESQKDVVGRSQSTPAWVVIENLFRKHGAPAPPYPLRDELVMHYLAHRSETPPEVEAEKAKEAWDWFAKYISLSLTFDYPDEEGEPGRWEVHQINGSINDREWELIGVGDTPLQAVVAAQATKATTNTGTNP